MAILSNSISTLNPDDGRTIFNIIPPQANPVKLRRTNIKERAHLRFVVGRDEIVQHFNAPARIMIKKSAWPANRPVVSGSISPSKTGNLLNILSLVRYLSNYPIRMANCFLKHTPY
jgi:hypothetical protein